MRLFYSLRFYMRQYQFFVATTFSLLFNHLIHKISEIIYFHFREIKQENVHRKKTIKCMYSIVFIYVDLDIAPNPFLWDEMNLLENGRLIWGSLGATQTWNAIKMYIQIINLSIRFITLLSHIYIFYWLCNKMKIGK